MGQKSQSASKMRLFCYWIMLDFGTGMGHNTVMLKPTTKTVEERYKEVIKDGIKKAQKVSKIMRIFNEKVKSGEEKMNWAMVENLEYFNERLDTLLETMDVIS